MQNIRAGNLFDTIEDAKTAINAQAIKRYALRVLASDTKRYFSICRVRSCNYRINVIRQSTGMFKVTIANPHTCHPMDRDLNRVMPRVSAISHMVEARLKNDPRASVNSLRIELGDKLKRRITYNCAWRAKQAVLANSFIHSKNAYSVIPAFSEAFVSMDPDNLCKCEYEGGKFKRLVVGNGASKKGSKHCLHLLFLDGAFLKSKHGGTILFCSTQDSNGSIYILAYAMVDGESIDNWEWFLGAVVGWIPGLNSDKYTIISDREQGIIDGVSRCIPQANHVFCIRHLCVNVYSKFGSGYDKLIWKLAKVPSEGGYDALFSELKQKSEKVASYLQSIDRNSWTNAFSKAKRHNHWTSNVAECVNSTFRDARERPIIYLIDDIQKWICQRFATKREEASRMKNVFVNSVEDKMRAILEEAPLINLIGSHGRLTYCETQKGERYTITPSPLSCSCKGHLNTGIPCSHLCAYAQQAGDDPFEFIDDIYRRSHLVQAYSGDVHLVSLDSLVPDHAISPPQPKTKRGRPRKKRFKSRKEKSSGKVRCGTCRRYGHNKRSCTTSSTSQ